MKRAVILASAAALLPLGEARGYFDNGNELYAVCQDAAAKQVALCVGTIVGHYDMMLSLGYRCGNDTQKTKMQLRDVAVKYMQDNPANRSWPAAAISFIAFLGAFHCTTPQIPEQPAK